MKPCKTPTAIISPRITDSCPDKRSWLHIEGSNLRARWLDEEDLNNTSDFSLVEFQERTGATPYYLGWSNLNSAPSEGTFIHHPREDSKKISIEEDPLTSTNYLEETVDNNANYWRVEDWEIGVAEQTRIIWWTNF